MRTTNAGLILVSCSLIAAPLAAQDRQVRELADFDSVSVGGSIDLYLTLGDTFRVEVDAPADVLQALGTRVEGGTLEIHQAHSGSFFDFLNWGNEPADVYVTLPRLVSVMAGGGADVEATGPITGDSLAISAAGGSDVELEVTVDSLEVNTSGGADVALTGSARRLRVNSSGGSDLEALGLAVEVAEINSSGGADVDITVGRSLVGRASGGSDISYAGTPDTVDVETSGGADISRR